MPGSDSIWEGSLTSFKMTNGRTVRITNFGGTDEARTRAFAIREICPGDLGLFIVSIRWTYMWNPQILGNKPRFD